MAILTFRSLLAETGLDLERVRLIRHQEVLSGGVTPYQLWREKLADFELYQSTQSSSEKRRSEIDSPFWATFVGTPEGRTLFTGLYSSRRLGVLDRDLTLVSCPWIARAGSCDIYEQASMDHLRMYAGRLFIDWGSGYRSWVQRAHRHEKPVVALYESYSDPAFPGYQTFSQTLSSLASLPEPWKAALKAVGGVYLLTCPRTGEQYVGSAYGGGGFLARWSAHIWTGGDAAALRERKPEDYRVSILQAIADTTSSTAVVAAEDMWKSKLGSRVHGLNRN